MGSVNNSNEFLSTRHLVTKMNVLDLLMISPSKLKGMFETFNVKCKRLMDKAVNSCKTCPGTEYTSFILC